MFHIMFILHLLGSVVGIISILLIFNRIETEYKTGLVLAIVCALVGVGGYCFELKATTVYEMIMAVKIGYLGKAFVTTFIVWFIAQYYECWNNQKLFNVLFFFDVLTLFLIETFDYHWLFYTDFNIVYADGFYSCEMGKAPLYYVIMVAGELKMFLYILICAKQKVERHTLESRIRGIILIAGIIPFVCNMVYFLGLSGRYDICPLGSIFGYSLMTIAIRQVGLFDSVQSAREIIVESSEEAIYVVDRNYRVLYANHSAKQIYPELKKDRGTYYFKIAKMHIEEKIRYYDYNGKFYELHCSPLLNGSILHGHIVWMIDITELRQYNLEILDLKDKAEMATQAKTDFLANMSHEIRTPMNAIIGMSDMALMGGRLPARERDYIVQIKSAGKNLLAIINDILDFSKIESGKMEIVPVEYEVNSVVAQLVGMVETRIGDKNIVFSVYLSKDFPRKLYGDDIRIQQVLLNLLTNAVKFTKEGAVTLKLDYRQGRMYVEVSDTGIGIREKDKERLFETFQQVDTKRNRSIEGSGLGLSISKQLVSLMGGSLMFESLYEVGSCFYFDLPQRIVDGEPGIRLKNKEVREIGIWAENDYVRISFCKVIGELSIGIWIIKNVEAAADYLSGENHWLIIEKEEDYRNAVKLCRDGQKGKVIFPGKMFEMQKDLTACGVYRTNGVVSAKALVDILNGEEEKENVIENKTAQKKLEGRLLLVDDNLVNLKVAVGLLEGFDLETDTAVSAAEAIEKLKKNRYDIIFMDHMMPEMDGIEATHVIRKMEGDYYKTVPIIAFTANAVSGAKEKFLAEGMNDFIPKPLDYEMFVQKIGKWL